MFEPFLVQEPITAWVSAAHPFEPPSGPGAALQILFNSQRHGCGLRLARAPDDVPLGRAQLPDLG
ncbi:hypothetical protein EDC62_1785 [Tibeticola sediminis]|uniref:Uncharacterized protein n=1 Tax=Tibeticola sediminis TaxID=1917811 RepID=A0A3N4U7J9_9BURK|nr:hypothetical protein [Tibeticola sediminis]RPE66713.1 hypothetical protein EDC62_1785 [Tibeticola sediminis]